MPGSASVRKTRLITVIGTSATVLLLIILLAVLIPKNRKQTPLPEKRAEADRIECPGFRDAEECEAHGCKFDAVDRGPSCFMEKNRFSYTVKEATVRDKYLFEGELANVTADTPYGPSLESVSYQVVYVTEEIVRVKLSDIKNERYEVPVQKNFDLLFHEHPIDDSKLKYEVKVAAKSETFNFQVIRKSDRTILWDTNIGGLTMSDQYLQIASYLPSRNVYGLGEHVRSSLRHDLDFRTLPMFARDIFPEAEGINLYGVHPFYTCLENSTKSHGVLFLNSNAMEVTLMPEPAISFRTIGGVIDLLFFVGDDPEHVVQLYTSVVGRPMLPPYWGLGFQLSRYGYNKLDNVKAAIERTRKAGIAQDVQFLDIDHMENSRDFTVDKKNFAGLADYIKKTKAEYGLKWIFILDPAIEAAKGYSAYESGLADEVFIKRSPRWEPDMFPENLREANVTFGKVWPQGPVAFPDFLNPKTRDWWMDIVSNYYKKLPFDGLWIDMNEPSNFGTNEKQSYWTLKCPKSPFEDPPYNPLNVSGSDRLSLKTICMESVQSDGTRNYLHYDVHSLYGWSESEPTLMAAQKATNSRSLVISRSTYPSSGRHAGHWLGDNKSSWDDLRRSVIGIMDFNIFGIPYIGADVCGFMEDTTDELCKRWMQLGAFYPFFRNHNGMGQKDQDPGVLGSDAKQASLNAVEQRYMLRPYLYTLFYRAHTDGSTVVRPLFHEFPDDENTWNNGKQFMWGKCLLISPVLDEGSTSLDLYLPKAEWWRFKYQNYTRPFLPEDRELFEIKTGEFVTKHDISDIPVHARGGCIIPTEVYELNPPKTVEKRTFNLFVYLQDGKAEGELYIDALDSIDPLGENQPEKQFDLYTLLYYDNTFELRTPVNSTYGKLGYIWSIKVFRTTPIKSDVWKREIPTTQVRTMIIDRKLSDITTISMD